MRKLSRLLSALVVAARALPCWRSPQPAPAAPPAKAVAPLDKEVHLANVRQLTFGGENAEAYFSFDGTRLSFQATRAGGCDQIYTMNIDGSDVTTHQPGRADDLRPLHA